jgi:3-deoxy-D-manno-octulosonate 8-phosphate phosphatase KdsC-like HAD superfamily phosphatase
MYNLVSDIDGVITCGGGFYSKDGIYLKHFEINAIEAVEELRRHIKNFYFISAASSAGFAISENFLQRLEMPLTYVIPQDRLDYIKRIEGETIFIGDGIYDAKAKSACKYFITLQDATPQAKEAADIILPTVSGSNVLSHLLYWLDNK